ncbi:MAG: hypothetical protein ACYDB3_08095 [Acidimicrobiales bacterium]
MIAALLRISGARTVLGVAAHLADGQIEVDDEGIGARSRSERPRPAQALGEHPVESANVAEGEGPQDVPSVDGAMTRCGRTAWVAPARSMSAWSI